jgi:hypothetical protein
VNPTDPVRVVDLYFPCLRTCLHTGLEAIIDWPSVRRLSSAEVVKQVEGLLGSGTQRRLRLNAVGMVVRVGLDQGPKYRQWMITIVAIDGVLPPR